ncbi:MAG: DUF1848 family protein [Candidatus Methanoperedens sp.]
MSGNNIRIGITERGDAGLNLSWVDRANEFDGLVLITKRLSENFIQQAAKVNSIVHATITGHGGTIIEPNVIPYGESKVLFKRLVNVLGHERVVLRIDPIIPTESGITTALKVYKGLHTEQDVKTRVRISFLDNYPHVRSRFSKAGLPQLPYQFHAPLSQRKDIAARFPDAEICGEPGFPCTGCISEKDLKVLGLSANNCTARGQRAECRCLAAKTELFSARGQCPHGCLYCYWK